ncbi:gluconokinase [Wenxinia saemankumensis]|uniref:Gluconokinase n=1 Tax=Wenxinia saemankumensis TaxID=1447782 RepID=A0A1M6G437_9RHOB|nr:gluconokinase [Wenxinia saemankumensis]SHJ04765.1 gluconate kinase, SKI family [Wenxinia saemankumensis]
MRQPIVVMGVSGSGKSLIGRQLADRLGAPFVDGDDLHPRSNVEKMAAGHPLTDEDRWPWLAHVGARLAAPQPPAVIACSALKRIYRDHIARHAGREVAFVLLDGPRDVLRKRVGLREGHFMPPELLDSQLATLERPASDERAVTVDVTPPPAEIVERIIGALPDGVV